MNKLIKRIVAISAAMTMTVSMMSVSVSAITKVNDHKFVHTPSSNYKNEWERTYVGKVGNEVVGFFVYGFDKDWINEDYTWTKGRQCKTKAGVKRGFDSSINWESYAKENSWSKEEVRHNNSTVKHYIYFVSSYPTITWTNDCSSYKDS